ncbi:hypothetical protein [Pedobacter sp. GR22-6]|uniref:hypothetical protein n=1 Tax=Pedobacter sp. GR22-6 TaxID=3127957 RepID=UPI00307E1714
MERSLNMADFKIWKASVRNFTEELKFRLDTRFLGEDADEAKTKSMRNLQELLVAQNDKINDYLFTERPLWSGHTDFREIKAMYAYSQSQLDHLLNYLATNYSPYFNNQVKYSSSQLRLVIPAAKSKVYTLKHFLGMHLVDPDLIHLMSKDILQLLFTKKYSPENHHYVLCIANTLLTTQKVSTSALIMELIRHNFNTPAFYKYITERFHARLLMLGGLHKQLELIVLEKDELFRAREFTDLKFTNQGPAISLDFLNYLNEKYEHTNALMEIKRHELKDRFEPDHLLRILLNTSVPQLGLFIRLLVEKDIVQQAKMADLFKFFSSNFYTKNANFISAKSLQDKSTSVRLPDALRLYRFFKSSMEWLEVNFHVKEHNRAMR